MSRILSIGDLKPDPKNARRHTPRNVGTIVDALHEVGAARSIVIDENGVILAGNATIEAAAEAGIEKVQVVDVDGETIIAVRRTGLTPKQKTQLALFDNRAAEMAEWDESVIAEMTAENGTLDGLFSDDELAAILEQVAGELKEAPEAEIDRAAELQEKWQCARGQIWQIGNHRLLCGDSTKREDVERLMDGAIVKCVVTDPPYGIGWDTDYTRFTTEYGTQRTNHQKVTGDDKPFDPRPLLDFERVVLWGANWYCQHIPLGSWLVWDKRHANGEAWLSDAEIAWMKGSKGVYIYAETVQGAHRKKRSTHPTQKPVGLVRWCFEKAKICGVVYDPYLGSGTTMAAAEQSELACYAMEIEPKYCAVTLERMSNMGLEPKLL